MTTGWPSDLLSAWPMMRAAASEGPPAGVGTIRRTCLAGSAVCANAYDNHRKPAAYVAASKVMRLFMRYSSWLREGSSAGHGPLRNAAAAESGISFWLMPALDHCHIPSPLRIRHEQIARPGIFHHGRAAGSFAGAARQLDVSVPSIHKLIAALEAQLGVRLFERSHKGLTLTASGETYLDSSRPLLDELAALDRVVSRAANSPSGTLVIGAPSQLTHHLRLPVAAAFSCDVPGHPDRLPRRAAAFRWRRRRGGCVRAARLASGAGPLHRRLGRAKTVVAATPAYWARRGAPNNPGELTGHACLLVRNPAGILIDLWEFGRGADKMSVKVSGWLSSTDREVILNAVMAGEGVGRFSELSTRSLLQSGRLVPVLTDWEVQGGPPLNVLYRASQRRTPRVRAFLDLLGELLKRMDAGAPSGVQPELVDLPQWHRRGYGRASSVLRSRS